METRIRAFAIVENGVIEPWRINICTYGTEKEAKEGIKNFVKNYKGTFIKVLHTGLHPYYRITPDEWEKLKNTDTNPENKSIRTWKRENKLLLEGIDFDIY